jgi:hypothetical protein
MDIKFVTQQYVKRPEGIALTDLYFPQLKIHVEIDEGQHFLKDGTRVLQDKIREADIINATGHVIKKSHCCKQQYHLPSPVQFQILNHAAFVDSSHIICAFARQMAIV